MQNPPIAPIRPHTHSEHGVERDDPWHWLREREDPEVRAYLEAENAWTEQQLGPLDGLRKQLYAEMLGRIQEDDTTAPVPDGPWVYYQRSFEGRPYVAHCRAPREGGPEQVLLDVNELAEGHDYVSVTGVEISPDHRLLAYAIDTTGREIYELRFLDLERGELLEDRIEGAAPGVEWAADSRTLWWVALDEALRSARVFRHVLGQTEPDVLVFHEADDRFRVGVYATRSRAFAVVHCASSQTSEVHLLSTAQPEQPPHCLQPRLTGMRYSVAHQGGDRLWILTDHCPGPDGTQTRGAANQRLMQAPVDSDSLEAWEPVLEHRDDVQLVGISAFSGHLAITEREGGQLKIRVRELATGTDHHVELPESVATVSVGANLEFDTPWLRLTYGSLTTPHTVFRYHMVERRLEQVKQKAVPGYDPSLYRTERRIAIADDGVEVPISLVVRADVVISADTPMLLHGYSSYGVTVDPRFSLARVSLLDRGMVWAHVHARGSSYLGRRWYEQGKLEHKQNTFSDFIAGARALHAQGLSSPGRTVIAGGSAGGLLMGAVLNQAPDLATAALVHVPFVDVVSTMLDASLPLTAGEWEEWGDPREPEAFHRILAYSPYDNVAPQAYPDLLVIAGFNDPRVQYWEPAKWVAKLRAVATGGETLMWTHMGAGHAGRSGRYGWLEDVAFDYGWVLQRLGLHTTPRA